MGRLYDVGSEEQPSRPGGSVAILILTSVCVVFLGPTPRLLWLWLLPGAPPLGPFG